MVHIKLSLMAGAFFRRQGVAFKEYCKNVMSDYKTVATETVEEAKSKPAKAALYAAILGGLGYMYKTAPSELELYNEMAELRQRMALTPNGIHNKESDEALYDRTMLFNQRRLTYYNLWIVSLLVKSNEDQTLKTFASQEKSLRKWIVADFFTNIYDVGAFGKWWDLSKKMEEFDVSKEEFSASA